MPSNNCPSKKAKSFAIKLLFTLTILYFVLSSVPLHEYKRALVLLSAKPLFLILFLVISQVSLLATRWYMLAKAAGSRLSVASSFYGILMSFFFSQGLPASIGGDAFRLWWHRREGIKTGDALNIIVFDRIYGLLSLIILCALSVLLLAQYIGGFAWATSLVVIMAGMGLMLGLLVMPWSLGVSELMQKVSTKLPVVVATFTQWLLKMRSTLRKQRTSRTLNLLFLGVATHLLVVAQVFVVGSYLEPDNITMLMCLAVVPPALLVSYMPFSIAGWGVREASMVIAFGMLGIKSSTAIVISLIVGMSIFVVAMFGAVIWLAGGYKAAYAHEVIA